MADKERQEKSKNYEKACQAILHRHSSKLGYGWVEGSRYYHGKLSRGRRQIDVTIHLSTGKLIFVDCKHYAKKVNLKIVEEFDAMVRLDLVNEGIMIVSCVGFSKTAIRYAKARDIGLVTLNYTATQDEYVMRMDGHNLVGFLEELQVQSQFKYTSTFHAVNNVPITSEGSLLSVPVHPKQESEGNDEH